ncbi:MAG: DUF2273 domain-containing protein [Clostridia bacterium]|jgi:uncharacterized membrane protein|nr:DUF2273 domain-containing protein [Clostridia bacterium]
MWENILLELLRHRGKIIGLLVGFIFAYLVITYGFWRTFFIILCLYIGFIIGKRTDDNESLRAVIDRILKDR